VVADLGLGDGTLGVVTFTVRGRVVGWEDGRGGADDGADLVVHGLGLWLVDQLVGHKGAGAGIGRLAALGDDDVGVLVEVVVVLRLGADLGADLAGLGEVDVGVRWGQRRVGGAYDGAVAGNGGHCVTVSGSSGLVGFVRATWKTGRSDGCSVERMVDRGVVTTSWRCRVRLCSVEETGKSGEVSAWPGLPCQQASPPPLRCGLMRTGRKGGFKRFKATKNQPEPAKLQRFPQA
jgi:hypothetical protein